MLFNDYLAAIEDPFGCMTIDINFHLFLFATNGSSTNRREVF